MATQAQMEAARRNGAKSKGPVTDAGKEQSAANSTKHGLSAKRIIVLSNESNDAFVKFARQMEEKFQPVDDIERGFVTQAAAARWRLLRASVIETSLFDLQLADDLNEVRKMYPGGEVDEAIRLAVAFKKMTADRTLEMVGRYEARLSREYERAIRALDRVRAERKEQPIAAERNGELEKRQNEPDLLAAAPAGEPELVAVVDPPPVKLQNEPEPVLATQRQAARIQNEPKLVSAHERKLQNEPKPAWSIRLPEEPPLAA